MDKKLYNKMQGAATINGAANIDGANFEIKMAALLFMRGMNSTLSFVLANNVDEFRYFDDIMLSYVDRNEQRYTYVMQLKHTKKKSRMVGTEFNSLRGTHSVIRMCTSYAAVCEALKRMKLWTENVEFVVFTNGNLSTKCRNVQQTSILSTGGAVYTLDDQSNTFFEYVVENRNKEKELKDVLERIGWKEIAQLKYKDSAKAYFEEFANKFRLYSEQSDVRNLDEYIQHEITKAFGTNPTDTQYIFLVLMEFIRKWWSDARGYYLTQESSLWKDIVTSQIFRVCETNISELQKCNLRYNDVELEKIRKQIPQNAGVKILTDSIELTTLKVYQSISEMSFLLVDGKTFLSRFEEIRCLCKNWCDKLVIKERTLPFFEYLILYQKLIWVTSSDQKDDHLLRDGIHLKSVVDDIKFGHFTETSQNILLESELEFQGYKIPLHRITRDNEYLEERLNASIFSQLMSGNCILGTPLSEDECCYIPHTLQYEHMVKSEILLTSNEKLCFAISGISAEELRNFVTSHDRILCFREYMELRNRCRYIIVRSENDYNEIAHFRANVHWLHFEDGAFKWKKSTGDISFVEKYLDGNIRNISPFDVYDQTVIISADSGTDKSVLLTHLAFHLKKTNPEMWVIRVSLRDDIQELKRLSDDVQSLDVINFLLRAAGVKEEWHNLCYLYFKNMEMVYVLIDGYDEICPTYADKFSLMSKKLHASKVKQLWVTTNPSMKNKLEKDLLCLAYTL